MCVVSSPKMPAQEKPKEPAVIRNPFLDGIDPVMKSLRLGRSALRIERGAGRAGTTPAPAPQPSIPVPAVTQPVNDTRPVATGSGPVTRALIKAGKIRKA